MRLAPAVILYTLTAFAQAQQHTRDGEIHDADTRAWWHTTEALAGDSMEGRDIGSAAYQRAAEYVAERFRLAGLQPAGEGGSFFQSVPMHEVAVDAAGTSFTLLREGGAAVPLAFLREITINPAAGLAAEAEAPLTYRGYCGKEAMKEVEGKIVVCFGTQREGLPSAAERVGNARDGGARGVVNVDDPYFSIEPPRWPYAYARSVELGAAAEGAAAAPALPVMRISAEAFAKLIQGAGKPSEGSGPDAAKLLMTGGRKEPLPSFEIPARLRMHLQMSKRSYRSPNVLAVLPGSDPVLKSEYVVVAAHLDGYGYGTPVAGDKLYNGALDDAAYVALLIQFADDLNQQGQNQQGQNQQGQNQQGRAQQGRDRQGRTLKRSVLLCAFTGEEKGLLGSQWFIEHPTVPVSQMAADVNLDQLRPLFPLHILTALAIDDTTLGGTARQVGGSMGITLRADREAERGLLRRDDHYPFLRAGVPAIGFIFGYDPGTDAERRYREWYQTRYHRPQDDVTQPLDFDAASKFDSFFYRFVETLADASERPAFKAGSRFAKLP